MRACKMVIATIMVLIVTSCDPGMYFVLTESGEKAKAIDYGNSDLTLNFFMLLGGEGGLWILVNTKTPVQINASHLQIYYSDIDIKYKLLLNGEPTEMRAFYVNDKATIVYHMRYGNVQYGDKVIIVAKDFLCENGRCFDIDSLEFIAKKR